MRHTQRLGVDDAHVTAVSGEIDVVSIAGDVARGITLCLTHAFNSADALDNAEVFLVHYEDGVLRRTDDKDRVAFGKSVIGRIAKATGTTE